MSGYIEAPSVLRGDNAVQQVQQLYGYLTKLSVQLNYILNSDKDTVETAVQNLVQQNTDSVREETKSAASSLRQLIIKTAETVYKEMESIETIFHGKYEAISDDFGTFKQQTEARFVATDENITQNYNILSETIGEAEKYIAETQGYIRTGLLYYDENGQPRVGLAIGENLVNSDYDTKKYAVTLVSNRLSFWEQGNEVAWFSNRELHIKDAVFEGNLRIGNWVVDHDNGGFTIRWNGGT